MLNKVFKDPLYSYVRVEEKIIHELIDTPEFQRLRRIKQLSGVSMVFHIAEHTRFSHSLGTYELARQILEKVTDIKKWLNKYEQLLLLCSALLHDVGHGPYSHSFEHIFGFDHEQMSVKLITGNTKINKTLTKYNIDLPKDIASIINHEGRFSIIEQIVSSQLDCDRMDYLKRDAYFTGAAFGAIDTEKLIRGMAVREGKIVFKASSVPSIEAYLMSRYHMYYQVYYHKGARNYEAILEKIYTRIQDLIKNEYQFKTDISMLLNLFSNKDDIKAYIEMDDTYINGCIKRFKYERDVILSDLCERFINRKLFKELDVTFAKKIELAKIRKYENNTNYYYKDDEASKNAYESLIEETQIQILLPDNSIKILSEYSPIVAAFSSSSQKISQYIFYDEIKNV